MRSSYIEMNYGMVFRALILAHRPSIVVECGVLDGYSTSNIAHALRANRVNRGIESTFMAYDLWEGYDYKHGKFEEVSTFLREAGLLNHYVNLHYADAFDAVKFFRKRTVDFLHMDISNDGDVLTRTLHYWGPKISQGGIIAFEGGSTKRDSIHWMTEFNKAPIVPELEKLLHSKTWSFQVFTEYPSMTLLFKR